MFINVIKNGHKLGAQKIKDNGTVLARKWAELSTLTLAVLVTSAVAWL
jgi:hypothetical protein